MSDLIQQLINYMLTTPLAQYVTIAITVFYVIAHIIAVLPDKCQSKIPSWVMAIINAIAANYGKSKNAKATTKAKK